MTRMKKRKRKKTTIPTMTDRAEERGRGADLQPPQSRSPMISQKRISKRKRNEDGRQRFIPRWKLELTISSKD
jgi:hypothetical protein